MNERKWITASCKNLRAVARSYRGWIFRFFRSSVATSANVAVLIWRFCGSWPSDIDLRKIWRSCFRFIPRCVIGICLIHDTIIVVSYVLDAIHQGWHGYCQVHNLIHDAGERGWQHTAFGQVVSRRVTLLLPLHCCCPSSAAIPSEACSTKTKKTIPSKTPSCSYFIRATTGMGYILQSPQCPLWFYPIYSDVAWFLKQTTFCSSERSRGGQRNGKTSGWCNTLWNLSIRVPSLPCRGVVFRYKVFHRHFIGIILPSAMEDHKGDQPVYKWNAVHQIPCYTYWSSQCSIGFPICKSRRLHLELCCCCRWLSSANPDPLESRGKKC